MEAENARLYRRAEEALRLHDELLASVTHDLRSPLAAVKAQAQRLAQRATALATPEAERLAAGLAHINAAATRMNALIDELLDLAQFQIGQDLALNRALVNLVTLAHRAAAELRQVYPGHVFTVHAAAQEVLGHVDATRLERVLANLLSNAAKYSPAGSEVRLQVSQVVQDGRQWAILVVEDQGMGIPVADLPYIFERFHHGSNVAGRVPGTGLGLAGAPHHRAARRHDLCRERGRAWQPLYHPPASCPLTVILLRVLRRILLPQRAAIHSGHAGLRSTRSREEHKQRTALAGSPGGPDRPNVHTGSPETALLSPRYVQNSIVGVNPADSTDPTPIWRIHERIEYDRAARVEVRPEAEGERSPLPAAERAAMRMHSRSRRPTSTSCFPRSNQVEGAASLQELRPRASRSPRRAFSRRIGDTLVTGAIGLEAQVAPGFRGAIRAAEARFSRLEQERRQGYGAAPSIEHHRDTCGAAPADPESPGVVGAHRTRRDRLPCQAPPHADLARPEAGVRQPQVARSEMGEHTSSPEMLQRLARRPGLRFIVAVAPRWQRGPGERRDAPPWRGGRGRDRRWQPDPGGDGIARRRSTAYQPRKHGGA